MQEVKEIKVVPPATNGGGQRQLPPPTSGGDMQVERPAKPTIGRLFEILAAASLTGCFFVLGLNFESGFLRLSLLLLLMAFSFSAYKLAIRHAVRAAKQEEATRANRKYKVTRTRLDILKEVGVPGDVIGALSYLLREPPLPESTFLDKIATDPHTDLGPDRTNQFRDTILRYTEVVPEPVVAPSPKVDSAEPASTNSK